MLKNLILKSKKLLDKENDNLPLFMRGELEVIVRDENDNIINYQKGDNVVSNFMKHEIIHLLAGDLFSDNPVNHKSEDLDIYTRIQMNSAFHSPEINMDGMLFSREPYFFSIDNLANKFVNPLVSASTEVGESYLNPRYPVKMLFGTGSEYNINEWEALTADYGGETAVGKILGYNDEISFKNGIAHKRNYYSGTFSAGDGKVIQSRTIQPINTEPLVPGAESPDYLRKDTVFGIKGAIKDCFIENSASQADNWASPNQMANAGVRGLGRPSFIYSARSLSSVKDHNLSNHSGYVKIGRDNNNVEFDNKLIFSVVMPRTSTFYPYNGWILKEAGLFSDTLFSTNNSDDKTIKASNKMPCGTLLAKRYISPIMKTSDNSVEFIWSIYISPN